MKNFIISFILVFLLSLYIVTATTTIYNTDFDYNDTLTSRGWGFSRASGNYPDSTGYSSQLNAFAHGRNTTDSVNGAGQYVYIYRDLGTEINEGFLNVNGRVLIVRDSQTPPATARYRIGLRDSSEGFSSATFLLDFFKEKIELNIEGSPICQINISYPYDVNFAWSLNYALKTTSLILYQNGSVAGSCLDEAYSNNKNVTAVTIFLREEANDNYERYLTELEFTADEPTIFGEGIVCSDDSECISDYCLRGVCAFKPYKMACSDSYECLSSSCVNGFCTQAGLVTKMDSAKNEWFGSDSGTSNLIALIIILFFSVLIGIANIFLGFIGLIVLSMFFTIIGWLNPFLLIGFFVFTIASIMLLVILGKGEG